ncbi:MAG: ferric reductase-like transmembrane domain-containing protein [Firmicutes bacterium]|nr:ferric reductase-like transmembrane domain-containing protein [Bacillota bacterium]
MNQALLQASWDAVRASGFTAYVLLSGAVVLGLLLSIRWQSRTWPRLITNDMHNFLTLLALAFGVVHGVAAYLDPFMRFAPAEVLVPMASHYRPLWMAFGIVSLYLAVAVVLSTWLRPRIGYRLWRALHVLTFLVFAFATLHGLGTGSDTRTWWGAGIYALAAAIVLALTVRRLMAPAGRVARPRPAVAGAVVAAAATLTLWAAQGPLRPGWNRVANDGRGSGARITLASQVSAALPPLPSRFAAAFTGTMQVVGSRGDLVFLRVAGTFRGGARGDLEVLVAGAPVGGGGLAVVRSQVTLYRADGTAAYRGAIARVAGPLLVADLKPLAGGGPDLSLSMRWSGVGRTVQGSVQASPMGSG